MAWLSDPGFFDRRTTERVAFTAAEISSAAIWSIRQREFGLLTSPLGNLGRTVAFLVWGPDGSVPHAAIYAGADSVMVEEWDGVSQSFPTVEEALGSIMPFGDGDDWRAVLGSVFARTKAWLGLSRASGAWPNLA